MGPYVSENFKTLLLYSYGSFQPNFFYIFLVTVLTKLTSWHFGISFFFFKD